MTVGVGVGVGAGVGVGCAVGVGARVDSTVGVRVGATVGVAVEPQAARPTAAIAVPMMVVSFMSAVTIGWNGAGILAARPAGFVIGTIAGQRKHVIHGYVLDLSPQNVCRTLQSKI